jgi:hypothetical protein
MADFKAHFNPKGKSAMMSVSQNALSVRRVSFITNLSRLCSYMSKISKFSESALKRRTTLNGKICHNPSKANSLTSKKTQSIALTV